jgi:SAM-dependent methyltransferase
MTVHIAVVGIDGSGKSTLTHSLAALIAAECGLVAGSASGPEAWVRAPSHDLCGPGFHPWGRPMAARLGRPLRRIAKALTGSRPLYPAAKVLQMLVQDNATVKLAGRYRADVMVSDCNLLLASAGRARNYRDTGGVPPSTDDFEAAFRQLLHDRPAPTGVEERLPGLRTATRIARVLRRFRVRGIWKPDHVVFLDVSPRRAMARIVARGERLDRHENLQALEDAREGYLRALRAYARVAGPGTVHVVRCDDLSAGQVVAGVLTRLRPVLSAQQAQVASGRLGGTVTGTGLVARVFNPAYLFGYVGGRFFRGAWRDLLMPFSAAGRLLMREGYSARVMRAIYEPDPGLSSVPFNGHPLHVAVRDRLGILQEVVGSELATRLRRTGPVRVLSAPCGGAYDLVEPLQKLIAADPDVARRVRLVAADLDPDGSIETDLDLVADLLQVDLRFVRGDLTGAGVDAELAEHGPYDVVLFVGLSAWLPRPALVAHLERLRRLVAPGGTLITDCFTPASYALGGFHLGYRAGYYPPSVYRTLLDYAGFATSPSEALSGSNGINHVVSVRVPEARTQAAPRRAEPAAVAV